MNNDIKSTCDQQEVVRLCDEEVGNVQKIDDMKEEDTFYDINTMASMSECTGLIPSAVEDEAEAQSYGELYSIHKPLPVEEETT